MTLQKWFLQVPVGDSRRLQVVRRLQETPGHYPGDSSAPGTCRMITENLLKEKEPTFHQRDHPVKPAWFQELGSTRHDIAPQERGTSGESVYYF